MTNKKHYEKVAEAIDNLDIGDVVEITERFTVTDVRDGKAFYDAPIAQEETGAYGWYAEPSEHVIGLKVDGVTIIDGILDERLARAVDAIEREHTRIYGIAGPTNQWGRMVKAALDAADESEVVE